MTDRELIKACLERVAQKLERNKIWRAVAEDDETDATALPPMMLSLLDELDFSLQRDRERLEMLQRRGVPYPLEFLSIAKALGVEHD